MSYETLLGDAEYFYNEAEKASRSRNRAAERFSTASILFSFMAIESFINNMMADFASLPKDLFTVHEQGFLTEKAVLFSTSGSNAGRFELGSKQEYKRLEDKIMFLLARFGDKAVDKGSSLWQRFDQAKAVRDLLTHPKKGVTSVPTPLDAQHTLDVAREIIRLVSAKVWGKPVDL